MKVVAIVQARMGSTRLPNKVMRSIVGLPMIELLLKRLSKAKEVDQIVVATSIDPRNEPLVERVQQLGYACEQGSEKDVLSRYLQAAEAHHADVIVRITGDCPLVDPELVDTVISAFKANPVDYFSNVSPATYPDGLDIEVFTLKALQRSAQESDSEYDHEHVTPYIRNQLSFSKSSIQHNEDLSALRWTVDELEDLQVITHIFEHFAPDIHFSWLEVLELQKKQTRTVFKQSNN